MDEYQMRKSLGNDLYDDGSSIVASNKVKKISDNPGEIELYDSDGHIVIYRGYPDGREPLYDCDCKKGACLHVAAVAIFRNLSSDAMKGDDPELIAEIESKIDHIADDILNDGSYDEDLNCYDEWEIERYNIENYNSDVEYEHTFDICKRIVDEVREPENVIRLFDRLNTRVETDFEYNNGGFDEAFEHFERELGAAFHYASPELVSEVMSHGVFGSWAEKFVEKLPEGVYEEAYQIGRRNHTQSYSMTKMMFERGDYEDYVASSEDKVKAMLRVGHELVKSGDLARARAICSELATTRYISHDIFDAAELLSQISV